MLVLVILQLLGREVLSLWIQRLRAEWPTNPPLHQVHSGYVVASGLRRAERENRPASGKIRFVHRVDQAPDLRHGMRKKIPSAHLRIVLAFQQDLGGWVGGVLDAGGEPLIGLFFLGLICCRGKVAGSWLSHVAQVTASYDLSPF